MKIAYLPVIKNKSNNSSYISNDNNTVRIKGALNRNISFTSKHYPSGDYTDEEIRLAKKYLHVKNHREPLTDEIWKTYSFWNMMFNNDRTHKRMQNKIVKIQKLMNDLRNEIAEKDKKAKELKDRIAQKKREEADAIKKQN
jgi:oligoendopeptidase F